MNSFSPIKGQRGVVLVVALVMLTMVTLVALSSFNLTKVNLQIAQNFEMHAQTKSVAQSAIDDVISDYSQAPVAVLKQYDIDGDKVPDIRVEVTSACLSVRRLNTNYIDSIRDRVFIISDDSGGATTLLEEVVWDIKAVATDVSTGASSVIRQGVSQRRLRRSGC